MQFSQNQNNKIMVVFAYNLSPYLRPTFFSTIDYLIRYNNKYFVLEKDTTSPKKQRTFHTFFDFSFFSKFPHPDFLEMHSKTKNYLKTKTSKSLTIVFVEEWNQDHVFLLSQNEIRS